MKKNIVIFLLCVFYFYGYGQEMSRYKIGLSYGFGVNEKFPFSNDDHNYDIQFYKIQMNYLAKKIGKFNFEINIEPSYHVGEYYQETLFFFLQKKAL